MSILNTIDERLFVQAQDPWTATAATLATADGIQHISAELSADTNEVPSRVKTGSLGRLPGQRGRRNSRFNVVVPVRGSGTAGTLSDMDPILKAIFGASGTVVSLTSVTYGIAEANIGLTIGKFRDPAGTNVWNELLVGGLVDSWEINIGDEAEAELSVSGPSVDVIGKPEFGNLTTLEKRGLVSFPTEPTAPTFLGIPALAFVGSVTLNGVGSFKLERARLYGTMSRTIRYSFGSYYVDVPLNAQRTIGLDFSLFEEDTAAQGALRYLGRTRGTFDAQIVIGENAGNIHTFNFNNLTIGSPTANQSGSESILPFTGTASITNAAANDELVYIAT